MNGHGDGLNLKVAMKRLHPHVPTKTTHLVTSVWKSSIEGEVAIDPHDACTDGPRNCVGDVQIVGHDAGRQSILARIASLDRFLHSPTQNSHSFWIFDSTNIYIYMYEYY